MAITYRRLMREDVVNFDKEATALVLWAGEYGWVGRISSKGHAIMHAPDGETSMSISRESLRGRSGRNQFAKFERWRKQQEPDYVPDTSLASAFQEAVEKREHPDDHKHRLSTELDAGALSAPMTGESEAEESQMPVSEAPSEQKRLVIKGGKQWSTADDEPFTCSDCGKSFASGKGLGGHRRVHNPLYAAKPASTRVSKRRAIPMALTQPEAASGGFEVFKKRPRASSPKVSAVYGLPPMKQNEPSDCPDCGQHFEKSTQLMPHMKTHRLEARQCPLCGKPKKYMTTHMRAHARDEQRKSEDARMQRYAGADPIETVLALIEEVEELRAEVARLRILKAEYQARAV